MALKKKLASPPSSGRATKNSTSNWKQLCGSLLKEREQLFDRIARLSNENKELKRSLYALMHEDIPIDKEALLAQFGKEPPLLELIAELEKSR